VILEGGGKKLGMLDPDFFKTFPFISLDAKFTFSSSGRPSIILIGDKDHLGNFTVTQMYQEFGTPELYALNITFVIEILPDSSGDASISETAALMIKAFEEA